MKRQSLLVLVLLVICFGLLGAATPIFRSSAILLRPAPAPTTPVPANMTSATAIPPELGEVVERVQALEKQNKAQQAQIDALLGALHSVADQQTKAAYSATTAINNLNDENVARDAQVAQLQSQLAQQAQATADLDGRFQTHWHTYTGYSMKQHPISFHDGNDNERVATYVEYEGQAPGKETSGPKN